MNKPLQSAIARQEAVRRSRDAAWALFFAFALAVCFFVLYFIASLRASAGEIVAAEIYTLPAAALLAWLAIRLFAAARRLGGQLKRLDELLAVSARRFSPGEEVWSALMPWTGRRD